MSQTSDTPASHVAAARDAPAPAPKSFVAGDLHCSKCGYCLRTLHIDANCPECGRSVRGTIEYLEASTPEWWEKVQVGAEILTVAAGLVALAGLCILLMRISGMAALMGVTLSFMAVLLAVLGVEFLTRSQQARPSALSSPLRLLARFTMIGALASLAAILLGISGCSVMGYIRTLGPGPVPILSIVCYLLSLSATAAWGGRILWWGKRPYAAASAMLLALLIPAISFAILLDFQQRTIEIIVGLGLLLGGLLGAFASWRLSRLARTSRSVRIRLI